MISPYADFKMLQELIKYKVQVAAAKGQEGLTDAELFNIRTHAFCRHPTSKELILALLPWGNIVSTASKEEEESGQRSLLPIPLIKEFSSRSQEELARMVHFPERKMSSRFFQKTGSCALR